MTLLAIDPGNTHSGYIAVGPQMQPKWFGKTPNETLLSGLRDPAYDHIVIEMIGHYGTGMPAGREVFDTCVWIGRFWQAAERVGLKVDLIQRREVKLHLCGSARAKDGNVVQALIDRFAPGIRNHGKGVKNQPGWFYGFHADVWQAYALAVYWHDTHGEVTS